MLVGGEGCICFLTAKDHVLSGRGKDFYFPILDSRYQYSMFITKAKSNVSGNKSNEGAEHFGKYDYRTF